ncbi:MAG: YeeE/YedE family protein [Flavobacteriaceae bacterium]|nr:YeeE/YedE family protein [Flavobacteriaceae bacterium]
MKYIKYLVFGIVFGIIMTKGELISWFRIYEMFKFQSFHMYGVIGSAVGLGAILMLLFRKGIIKNIHGDKIIVPAKDFKWKRALFGGLIFGLGWALAGACPGPMFVLIGNGVFSILIVIFGALLGTFLYGIFKKYLPH